MEPWALKAVADAAMERTASQLRDLLKELAAQLEPFPTFLSMDSIQAVEVEPQGLKSPTRGCVVVCPDGELYELNLRFLQGPPEVNVLDHVEEFDPLGMPPQEYAPYAYAAIVALVKSLEAQGDR